MKKKVLRFLGLVVIIVALIGTCVNAEEFQKTHTYGIFELTCYINCTAFYGKGSTSGVAYPYQNYVSVQTYDINQTTISSSYKTAQSKVTLTLTKGSVYGQGQDMLQLMRIIII